MTKQQARQCEGDHCSVVALTAHITDHDDVECLLDRLPLDLFRNLVEWLEYHPADPVRFFLTCKKYHTILCSIFSPKRIAISLRDSSSETAGDGGAGEDHASSTTTTTIYSLGSKPFFVSSFEGKLIKEMDQLKYGTKYVFFTYCSELHQRLHLGRHVQIGPRSQQFSLGLFRPKELEQFWTIHPPEQTEENGNLTTTTMEEESSTIIADLGRVKLSVDGGRVSLYNNDPDGVDTVGFLDFHRNRTHNSKYCRWCVKNSSPELELSQLRQDATIVSLRIDDSQKQQQQQQQQFELESSPLVLHPKAVLNHQGLVCLYDSLSLQEPGMEEGLNHAGVAISVPLDVWIKDGHCRVHAPNLPFRIAVPICKIDGMDESCTSQTFLSSLYETYSRRVDYVVFYCAIAADDLDGSTRSPIESMLNQRLTHMEHAQGEEIDEDGNLWFYLKNGNEPLEPCVVDRPTQRWYATLGP